MKLGRLPRTYRPEVPHLSAVLSGRSFIAPPIKRDWSENMPADWGMMMNDKIGDCTAAAYYHARQLWSFVTGKEITPPDSDVEQLYEDTSDFNPTFAADTDNGAVEQDVLAYLLKDGAPGDKPIIGFLEVDVRNLDDVKRTINECGVAYIGINVPQSVMDNAGNPDFVWAFNPGDTIVGGHAVILVGYDLDGFHLVSWGKKYYMTPAFLSNYCDEAYAIASPIWVENAGLTPGGLTLAELETQMQALKDA